MRLCTAPIITGLPANPAPNRYGTIAGPCPRCGPVSSESIRTPLVLAGDHRARHSRGSHRRGRGRPAHRQHRRLPRRPGDFVGGSSRLRPEVDAERGHRPLADGHRHDAAGGLVSRGSGRWIQWVFLPYFLLWSFFVGGALITRLRRGRGQHRAARRPKPPRTSGASSTRSPGWRWSGSADSRLFEKLMAVFHRAQVCRRHRHRRAARAGLGRGRSRASPCRAFPEAACPGCSASSAASAAPSRCFPTATGFAKRVAPDSKACASAASTSALPTR